MRHPSNPASVERGVLPSSRQIEEGELWLPLFEKLFRWGPDTVANDVDLEALKPVPESKAYCRSRRVD